MEWIIGLFVVGIIIAAITDEKKEDRICWYSDNDALASMKERNKKENKYNYIYKHYSEDTSGSTFGGVNYRKDNSSSSNKKSCNGNHSWRYFNHFDAQKRECTKCYYRDPDYYIPNYYK